MSMALSPERHGKILQMYDYQAVEDFLALLPPEGRESALAGILGEMPDRFPAFSEDPRIQAALQKVLKSRKLSADQRALVERMEMDLLLRQKPVVLAIVPLLDRPDVAVTILRQGGTDGEDFIILRESNANWRFLALALDGLMSSRHQHGLVLDRTIGITITSSKASPGRYARAKHLLEMNLESISEAPLHDIPGLGSFPAVMIYP